MYMKPSKFIAHYERMLGRCLTTGETASVLNARADATGKRSAVKAMRAALLVLASDAPLGARESGQCLIKVSRQAGAARRR
jgi:hypothetical protein